MTATYLEAVDAMFGLFNTGWQANAGAVVSPVPEIRWQGVEERALPDKSKFWCRVSSQIVTEMQSTLGDYVGASTQRRYTTSGLLFVQLFCPYSDAQAFDKGRRLAQVARNIFRGKTTSNGVWFRRAKITELPPEPDWYRFNIVTEFEYDELA